MPTEYLQGSAQHLKRTGISPALASFATGASTTILTIAVTLVSLRSDASRESLFSVLSWAMYFSAACAAIVFGWILLDAIKRSLGELRHLSELEDHVPRLIRFRRRLDRVQVSADGDTFVHIECEIESAPNVSVPWLTFSIFCGADINGPEWQNFSITKISTDGVEFDPSVALMKKARSQILNNPRLEGIALEEWGVRVPISLEPDRRRCTVIIEHKMQGALAAIFEEDSYFADIPYVTDKIEIHITGVDDLRILCSSRADYRVQASQFSGELLDTTESLRQSTSCNMKEGVKWESASTKIGYRYEIPISAQRLPK